ncbi:MAG: ABC transporter ATP-binding protein [Planctomycetota bacterium]
MIEITDLRKLYVDTLAVQDVSFQLPSGVVCGLVGPNGAGKTTTMRCVAGVLSPTSGQISIHGMDPEVDPIGVKLAVAYVPDDPPLFDDLTVGQHLDFIARLYRLADHRKHAAELLNRFELIPKYDSVASSLSRGMRQKLAVACAYLTRPKVLLLDEPLTGLDPPGIRQLLASITEYAQKGNTVLISSHLLAMIGDVCDRLLLMQDGEVRHQGTLASLRNTYPNAETLEDVFFAATTATAEDETTDHHDLIDDEAWADTVIMDEPSEVDRRMVAK